MIRRIVQWIVVSCVLLAVAGGIWWSYPKWRASSTPVAVPSTTPAEEEAGPTDTIIVGDQAQKNLGLTAKRLQTEVFWKTITVQGMIVDRPGMSDREVVAPAIGTISQIFHVPGDMVRPGDILFTLKLASESLQQTQTELFKTSQDIKLAEARRKRLESGGEAIAQSRIIEVESDISRLKIAAQAYQQELINRGLSQDEIDGVADGKLLSEISLVVPPRASVQTNHDTSLASTLTPADEQPFAYEFQELKVELGEQVQAGQTLCHLSNHQLLAVEGRAFRDETSLLERSVKESWPVEVDFQEDTEADWPPMEQAFLIRYIANTIDPITRTFGFLLPLENQYKTVDHGDTRQLLWRFRPGQKVLLRIRVEKLDSVFVLPADAVVWEGAEAFVFTQNVNTFERKSVHVLYRDRDRVVLANDGTFPTFKRGQEQSTIAAIAQTAAAQLNRMTKSGSGDVPKGFHIHADGSLHKNEDEAQQ
jgi:cobalt-zinc-cadmium efflux system membrane fusion protein